MAKLLSDRLHVFQYLICCIDKSWYICACIISVIKSCVYYTVTLLIEASQYWLVTQFEPITLFTQPSWSYTACLASSRLSIVHLNPQQCSQKLSMVRYTTNNTTRDQNPVLISVSQFVVEMLTMTTLPLFLAIMVISIQRGKKTPKSSRLSGYWINFIEQIQVPFVLSL